MFLLEEGSILTYEFVPTRPSTSGVIDLPYLELFLTTLD